MKFYILYLLMFKLQKQMFTLIEFASRCCLRTPEISIETLFFQLKQCHAPVSLGGFKFIYSWVWLWLWLLQLI